MLGVRPFIEDPDLSVTAGRATSGTLLVKASLTGSNAPFSASSSGLRSFFKTRLISILRFNICTKEGWLLRLLFCCQTFWYSQNSAHFIVHFICQLHSNQIDFLLFPRSTEASATSPGNFYKNLNNRFLDQTLSNVLLMFEISRGKKSQNFQNNWIFLPLRSTRHQSDA